MKIEIEFEEVETLKKEVEKLTKYNKILQDENYALNKLDLVEKATRLSQELTEKALKKVFEELGFEDCNIGLRCGFGVRDSDGKYWWNSDNIEVELGAHITTKFREAFLKIGVKPKSNESIKADKIELPD